jgi:hypothetical protein
LSIGNQKMAQIWLLRHKLHGLRFGNNSFVNFVFIGLYGIDTNVINLFVLFEYWCHVHCLNTNVICLFVFFKHRCCMSIFVVYTQKSCTWLPCLKNAWHLCLNNTNLWNNNFTRIWNEPMKLVNLWCRLAVKTIHC